MSGHHLHHLADRAGLPFGVGSIAAAAALDWVRHNGLSLLSGCGMAVGIVCTLTSTALKVGETFGWWDRWKWTRRGA